MNKPPIENNLAPGEAKASSKPQPKGESVRPKPPTVVVKYPNGDKVVTVPSIGIKPVKVERTKPVVLNGDVDVKPKTIQNKLEEEDKINEEQNVKRMTADEIAKKASIASAQDLSDSGNFDNSKYKSSMTLYHWNLLDTDQQLDRYKDTVYKGNMLEDLNTKARVLIKLNEEETEKV